MKRALLLVADIAGVVLTVTAVSLTLTHSYLYAGRARGVALFAGIALIGFSAYRRDWLGRMLLLPIVLMAILIMRIAIGEAVAIAIPTLAWTVVLGVSANRNERWKRGLVAGLLITGALALLVLGYYLPIFGAAVGGLAGGGHGPSSHATSQQIASVFVPFAAVALACVGLAVFVLVRKTEASK